MSRNSSKPTDTNAPNPNTEVYEVLYVFLFLEFLLQSNLVNMTLVYRTPSISLDITTHFCKTKLFGSKLPFLYDYDTR